MMSETGKVVAVEDNAVWVATERGGTCGSCAARSGCGHSLLASLGRNSNLVRALVPDGVNAVPALHDEVRISIPERGFLRGVAVLYLLPLLCMLAAAIAAAASLPAATLAQSQVDLAVTLSALAGLALGLVLLRGFERRNAHNPMLQPRVTERL